MTTIQHAVAFTDGSGVEALIIVDGVRFACSYATAERQVFCLATCGLNRGALSRANRIAASVFATLCAGYVVSV